MFLAGLMVATFSVGCGQASFERDDASDITVAPEPTDTSELLRLDVADGDNLVGANWLPGQPECSSVVFRWKTEAHGGDVGFKVHHYRAYFAGAGIFRSQEYKTGRITPERDEEGQGLTVNVREFPWTGWFNQPVRQSDELMVQFRMCAFADRDEQGEKYCTEDFRGDLVYFDGYYYRKFPGC